MIGAIFTTAVLTAAGVYAVRFARQWRDARAVIKRTQAELDRAIPYWPAEEAEVLATHAELLALLCGACNDGTGTCICTGQCGEWECMGVFSDADIDWLESLTAPEGTDQ